jgi:hypothetical protein
MPMAQFDVHRNPEPATRDRVPYVVDLQYHAGRPTGMPDPTNTTATPGTFPRERRRCRPHRPHRTHGSDHRRPPLPAGHAGRPDLLRPAFWIGFALALPIAARVSRSASALRQAALAMSSSLNIRFSTSRLHTRAGHRDDRAA